MASPHTRNSNKSRNATRLKKALFSTLLIATCLSRAYATDISFYFPIAVDGPVAKRMSALVAAFEQENPDIRVKPIYTGTYKDSIIKALTAHKSGAPPDAAVLFAVDIYTLIDNNAIVPFDEMVANAADTAWLGSFYPALMANSRAAGQTWGIPFQRSTILMYWNKKLFTQAGLDPNRPPTTWADMTAYAKKLTRSDSLGNTTQWGVQIPSSGFPYWLFQGLATANGARLMNAAGTQTTFDNPAVVEALQYWVDLARLHKAQPPGVVEWGNTPRDFIDGKAAMIFLIERDRNSPSIDTLSAVLDALGTTLAGFFGDIHEPTARAPFYTQAELTEIGDAQSVSYRMLSMHNPNCQILMLYESYEIGAYTGEAFLHKAQDAGFVLQGQIEETVSEPTQVLTAADGYYFDSQTPHRFRNVGNSKAQIISDVTPPTY